MAGISGQMRTACNAALFAENVDSWLHGNRKDNLIILAPTLYDPVTHQNLSSNCCIKMVKDYGTMLPRKQQNLMDDEARNSYFLDRVCQDFVKLFKETAFSTIGEET